MVTNAAYAFQDCELTPEQQSVLHFSYSYGEPHNVGYTLAAIAMQESDLGRYLINISDPSGGVWHLTVDKAVNKLGWEHTPFNYNRAIQLLVDDIHFAADIALDTVLWWHNYHDGDWFKTWSGYNGGFKGNPKYAHQIAEHIKTIKECKWVGEG
jgi:hypothetical protein